MTFKCGEKPGKGTYVCTLCGTKVTLGSDEDILPPCPTCGNCDYDREM